MKNKKYLKQKIKNFYRNWRDIHTESQKFPAFTCFFIKSYNKISEYNFCLSEIHDVCEELVKENFLGKRINNKSSKYFLLEETKQAITKAKSNLSPDFIGDNPEEMEIGTITPMNEDRRPSKKNSRKNNKKYPYKKVRKN